MVFKDFARLRDSAAAVLILVPIATFVWMFLAFVIEGIDLPFLDDWLDLPRSILGDLSPGHLFELRTSTIYPLGKALDSLFLPWLGGNTLAYQLITLTVILGALLLLQWKLLDASIDDPHLARCAFVLSIGMLQPGSYWGQQYFAYHQALPILFLVFALYVTLCAQWRPRAKLAIGAGLGLAAGFSYISGAFAGLAGAAALITIGRVRTHRADILPGGIGLAMGTLAAALMQALMVVAGPHAELVEAAYTTSAFSVEYWAFVLGKVGRSLALPEQYPIGSLTVTLTAVVVSTAAVICAVSMIVRRGDLDRKTENLLCVIIFLAVVLFVYLGMVAFARTNLLRPAGLDTFPEIFIFGFRRFHFFWVTLIWPWVFAALLVTLRGRMAPHVLSAAAFLASTTIVVLWLTSDKFDYREVFAESRLLKVIDMSCIRQQLLDADVVECPRAFIRADYLTLGYAAAVAAKASFVDAIPPSLRRYNKSPRLELFAAEEIASERLTVANAETVVKMGASLDLSSSGDPVVEITTAHPARMANCLMLALRATVTGAAKEIASLSYLPAGQKSFQRGEPRRVITSKGGAVELVALSRSGFENRLRFQPISGAGAITVSDLSVRCWVLRSTP